ncbi:MAG: hypothetical protein ACREQ2_24860 [Candidatus Binatia bacterium]
MADVNIPDSASVQAGYETSDLSPRNISLFGAGLTVLIIVVLLASYGLMVWLRADAARRAEPPSPLVVVPEPTPGPRLEIQPGRALKAMREQEEAHLRAYGWIDQEKGIVHIPIERAMEILVKKGLPARQSKAPATGDGRGAKQVDAPRGEPRS